jgi:hypothetical protein
MLTWNWKNISFLNFKTEKDILKLFYDRFIQALNFLLCIYALDSIYIGKELSLEIVAMLTLAPWAAQRQKGVFYIYLALPKEPR